MYIQKVLNNNVVIANNSTSHDEVILIGKGIGFNRHKGDEIRLDKAEKVYRLENQSEQEKYKQLLPILDEDFITFMHDVLSFIEAKMGKIVNEHVHIGLTDHIAFAIKRAKDKIYVKNPFLIATESLYPKEYQVAKKIVSMIKEYSGIELPDGEIGLIALHIHSAITDRDLHKINQFSELIYQLIKIIEDTLEIQIDHNSIHYYRLIQHLRRGIERVNRDIEHTRDQSILAKVLKHEYPLCYNLAWKIVKVIQQALQKPVDESEIVYLTIHLQRLID
jgi:transcriptional antiterminator